MDPVPQHREPDGAGVEPFEHDARMPATGQGETPAGARCAASGRAGQGCQED